MKIYFASDLHLLGNEPGGDDAVAQMAQYLEVEAKEEDVLVLIGDLGHGDLGIMNCLALFAGFPGKKAAVLGNHDLWSKDEIAQDRYRLLQERVLPSCGFHSLDLEPLVHQGVGFVGSLGWYDYSLARAKGFTRNEFASLTFPDDPRHYWGDRDRIHWLGLMDEEVVELQCDKLYAHLQQLQGVKQIIVAMHHLPTKKLLPGPRFLVPRVWGFMNAFLGSSLFGEVFREFRSKIARVFCGHVHHHMHVSHRGVNYTSLGGDYRTKELLIYDPDTDEGRALWFA